ncbi:class C sortase (plasmid) [Lactococcus garvieae]|uniref:class C sortase n=1 Tax=Lactococcus garvieae TaxID=1363 RepID=UPI0030CE0178
MDRTKKRGKGTSKLLLSLACFFIFSGVAILLYPIVGNYVANQERSVATKHYDDHLQKLSAQKMKEQKALARAYNDYIFERQQGRVGHHVDYKKVMDLDAVMGTIDIPAINLRALPFYKGTSYETLDKGVGHFEPSSIPIGGNNTRSVLTGHSGLKNQLLFTDINRLKAGDIFFINILGEKLAYEIDSFEEVLPSEVEKAKIIPGEDRATLVTCTPPGINTYRLLVNGKRIPYEEAVNRKYEKRDLWTYQNIVLLSLGSCVVLFTLLFFIYRYLLKRSKSGEPERARKASKKLKILVWIVRGLFISLLVAMLVLLGLAIYGYNKMNEQPDLPEISMGQDGSLSAYNFEKISKGTYTEQDISSVNVKDFSDAKVNAQDTMNEKGIGKLSLPSQDVDLPILAGLSQGNLLTGASTYRKDQILGRDNYVLLAHNIWNTMTHQNSDVLFNRIASLKRGDVIEATDFENIYSYRVTRNDVIKDTEVEVVDHVKKDSPPLITLIRCEGGIGTEERRVVQGEFVKKKALKEASEEELQQLKVNFGTSKKDAQLFSSSLNSAFLIFCMALASHILADPVQIAVPMFILLVFPVLFLSLI